MIQAFDFSKICTQGAYFSSFIACSLQDYLQELIIPETSRYHVVGCSPSLLKVLARIDILHIVEKYRKVFAERQTIIDLLLPYYDNSECRYYLGRFIIFRGQLLGIRLNSAKNIHFNSWTPQKTKIVKLKDSQTQTNILVGYFSINLTTLRIGLLFGDQVLERGNQYINNCFDVIVLMSEENQDDIRLQSKINELSMKSLLIEVKSKERFRYLQLKHLQYLNEGSINFLQKNKIEIAYYTFDKIYATKLRLKPKQKTMTALQIDQELLQAQGSLDYQANIFPHCALQQQLRFSNSLKKQHQLYLGRFLNMFCFNEGTKIILIVEQTPTFLCLLYILKDIFRNKDTQVSQCINRLFRLVGKNNRQFDFFLMRSNVLDPNLVQRLQECYIKSAESYWLQLLSKIGEENYDQWFTILGNEIALEGVVDLLNKRKKITIGKEDFLQTWVVYEFFSYQELVNLYFSQGMKSFINDDQYLIDIWNKNPSLPFGQEKLTFRNENLKKLNIDLKIGHRNYEQILDYNNEIHYSFERWLSRIDISLPREKMFSHFWFRNIGIIRPSYQAKNQHFLTNIDQQLLALSKKSLLEVVSLFRQAVVSPVIQSQHRLHLNKIQREISKQVCHSCSKKIQKSYIFGCRIQSCQEYFCYLCLFKKFSYQPQNLVKMMQSRSKDQKQSIICPACEELCPQECLSCFKKTIKSKNAKPQIKLKLKPQNKVPISHKFQFKNRYKEQTFKQQIKTFHQNHNQKDTKLNNDNKEDFDEETCLSKLKQKNIANKLKIQSD